MTRVIKQQPGEGSIKQNMLYTLIINCNKMFLKLFEMPGKCSKKNKHVYYLYQNLFPMKFVYFYVLKKQTFVFHTIFKISILL